MPDFVRAHFLTHEPRRFCSRLHVTCVLTLYISQYLFELKRVHSPLTLNVELISHSFYSHIDSGVFCCELFVVTDCYSFYWWNVNNHKMMYRNQIVHYMPSYWFFFYLSALDERNLSHLIYKDELKSSEYTPVIYGIYSAIFQ